MEIIIQHNLINAHLLEKINKSIQKLPHRYAGLIPFSREITSDTPLVGTDFIPYGSTSFIETTYELKWKGLHFNPDIFNYHTAIANRDDMLNAGFIVPAKDVAYTLAHMDPNEPIFARPSHDLKQFSGYVPDVKEFCDFVADAMACGSSGSYQMNPETLIVISTPKQIVSEWRWFVVGGEVVSGSLYRHNGQLVSRYVEDAELTDIAEGFAKKWLPDCCCAMDIALLSNGEYKVIEFNCINGSGFYENDISAVFEALYDFHDTK